MFYQVCEDGKVVGKYKSRRQANAAVAEDLDHRTLRCVKYRGTLLTVVRDYTKDVIAEAVRKDSIHR
jgi:hypothetical protein